MIRTTYRFSIILRRIILLLPLICGASGDDTIFRNCDNAYTLNPGTTVVQSPYYPSVYPAGSACRYQLTAPVGYTIAMNCTIGMPTTTNECSSETLYVSTEGDSALVDANYYCGYGTFTTEAKFRDLTLAYISQGFTGWFQCDMNVKPQSCDCGWSMSTRIVNGEAADIREHPHMVALMDTTVTPTLYCSGVIISPFYILTAAHCSNYQPQAANILAVVGRTQLTNATDNRLAGSYGISRIIVHPQYKSDTLENDLALMKTIVSIHFSRYVGPICLPPVNNPYGTFDYYPTDILGYGTIFFAGPLASSLRRVTLSTIDNESCQSEYEGMANITASHICTADLTGNGKDSCQYDSGGPVVYRKNRLFLLGTISFGVACGIGSFPVGVNTRVTSYLPWIHANSEFSTCPVAMY